MILTAPGAAAPPHPHVRRFNPWRDGKAIAALLEEAFRAEFATSVDAAANMQYLGMLRNYGPFEASILRNAIGYVWEQDGALLGHASVQRNSSRPSTWVVGNVATHPSARGRGIATHLVQHAVDAAFGMPGCATVALQVLEGNFGAARLYRQLGFEVVGAITRFLRRPSWPIPEPVTGMQIRNARGADRAIVTQLAQQHVPDVLRHADGFDETPYQLGLGWWLWNSLTGNRSAWFMCDGGALRVQANLEPGARAHVLELLLHGDAKDQQAQALVLRGLQHLDKYIDRSVLACAPRHLPEVGKCLRACGFQPLATYVHMVMFNARASRS